MLLAMFPQPTFIGGLINVALIVQLNIALRKLLSIVYRLDIGGMKLELGKLPSSVWVKAPVIRKCNAVTYPTTRATMMLDIGLFS